MFNKLLYKFINLLGNEESNTDTLHLQGLGYTPTQILDIQARELHVLELNSDRERKWRNRELLLSDRLLHVDSSYNGHHVATYSNYHSELMTYRTELRDYNLTSDNRPTRPAWYSG